MWHRGQERSVGVENWEEVSVGEVWKDRGRDRDGDVFGRQVRGLQDLGLPLWAWTRLRPEERKRR